MINRTAVDVAQPNTLECIPSPKTIDYTHELNNMDLIFIIIVFNPLTTIDVLKHP